MAYQVLEEKLFESFADSERQYVYQTEKVVNTLANIESTIIANKGIFNDSLRELTQDPFARLEIAQRLYPRLYNFYLAKGYGARDAERSKLMLSRIILTLSFELTTQTSSDDKHMEYLREILKTDLTRMYHYMKYESPLAASFENYA